MCLLQYEICIKSSEIQDLLHTLHNQTKDSKTPMSVFKTQYTLFGMEHRGLWYYIRHGNSECASHLSRFYFEVRSKRKPNDNEQMYHKNSLINIRAAINHHLADIWRDVRLK